MLIGKLFHIAIRTQDLDSTVAFYTEILGMQLAERPPFNFPGAWLQAAMPDSAAAIHVYAGDAAREVDGSYLGGTGLVDHVSFTACDYARFCQWFSELELPFRENRVPKSCLAQLFIHDPNGVQIELIFDGNIELEAFPEVVESRQYQPSERWFNPIAYQGMVARLANR